MLAQIRYKEHGLSFLEDMLPFIPKEQLQKIAEEEYEKNGLQYFEVIAPFLSKEMLSGYVQRQLLQRECGNLMKNKI